MPSEFRFVFSDVKWSDDFYRFLQEIFHLYPEDRFHWLLKSKSLSLESDEIIYREVQKELPQIRVFLSELRYALPALSKQKKEMARQVCSLPGHVKEVNGSLEIGSTGRYISELRKHLNHRGNIYLTNDISPDNSIADVFERGQWPKLGSFFPLNEYEPIPESLIPDQSLDLVSCHIGLHHCPVEKLDAYLSSIRRILRPGGRFILRDHDVQSEAMWTFVSLVHTVFNLGLNVNWETNQQEFRHFRPVEEWAGMVCRFGFRDSGARILQFNDPSLNTLMEFYPC
jgi:SAM-dependent methyltransferase